MRRLFDGKQHSVSGSGVHTVYESKVRPDGIIDLVPAGKEDRHAMIQAERDSTDLAKIVAYYNQTGDASVFNQRVGQFLDTTKLPKTMAEMLQLNIDAHAAFDSLSAEQKRAFDNDFNKFFATAGEKEWMEKLGYVDSPDDLVIEKEPVKEGVDIAS